LRAEETVTIAALFQAITAKLYVLRARNLTFRPYRRSLIMENKWRAARWGVRGLLIDFGKQAEVPYAHLLDELLEFVDDVVDELGSRKALQYVHRIVEEGTSADRQLEVFRKTGDLKRAFAAYQTCLSINPEYEEAHEYLGEAYVQSGDLPKAKQQLAWLRSRDSDEANELEESIDKAEGKTPSAEAKEAAPKGAAATGAAAGAPAESTAAPTSTAPPH
jgi:tetratricopeptide (TPR) repeat protein